MVYRGSPLAVAALLALAACAGPAAPPGSPAPYPADEPIAENEVRTFLETEAEVRAFLEAEADRLRAAEEADRVADDEALPPGPADPADLDIPIHVNDRVQFWIAYFQKRDRARFGESLERMGRYGPYIRARLRERGMPQDLVYLALIESGFIPVARSHASAVGIWQFMAATGRHYGLEVSAYVDERRDPVKSTDAALDYLQDLHARFGSWYLAAAAYNSGEGRVERILRRHVSGRRGDDALFWEIDQHLPRETRNYVPKLIAAAILATYPDRYGFGDMIAEPPIEYDVVLVPDATDLAVVAEAAGVESGVVERLNPHFVRGVTPPGRKVEVRIPAGRGETFAAAYEKIPPSRRVRVLEHTVRPGETLSHVAKRYGTTVRQLQETNRIRNPNSVRAGRRLIVRVGPAPDGPAAAASTAPAEPGRDATAPPNRVATGPALGVNGSVYTVRQGDSLWSIARRYGTTVELLREWNGLDGSAILRPGDVVKVPAGN